MVIARQGDAIGIARSVIGAERAAVSGQKSKILNRASRDAVLTHNLASSRFGWLRAEAVDKHGFLLYLLSETGRLVSH